MCALRISREQVEAARAARERALQEDPEFRQHEEDLAKNQTPQADPHSKQRN